VTPRLVVLSAPSGGGKTTITKEMLARRKDVGYSVSATTRAPRPGERDGQAYHFLSPARFAEMEAQGAFLETAEYAGARYGTLKAEVDKVLASGRHVVLDIEIAGAKRVRELYPWPRSVEIFVLPPSVEVLLERLRGRKTESDQAIAPRIVQAIRELAESQNFDYRIVNDDLDRAVREVETIIEDGRPRQPVTKTEQQHITRLIDGLTQFTRSRHAHHNPE
jgi:guanylate kinase